MTLHRGDSPLTLHVCVHVRIRFIFQNDPWARTPDSVQTTSQNPASDFDILCEAFYTEDLKWSLMEVNVTRLQPY
jgi:hypothetical protein